MYVSVNTFVHISFCLYFFQRLLKSSNNLFYYSFIIYLLFVYSCTDSKIRRTFPEAKFKEHVTHLLAKSSKENVISCVKYTFGKVFTLKIG